MSKQQNSGAKSEEKATAKNQDQPKETEATTAAKSEEDQADKDAKAKDIEKAAKKEGRAVQEVHQLKLVLAETEKDDDGKTKTDEDGFDIHKTEVRNFVRSGYGHTTALDYVNKHAKEIVSYTLEPEIV